VCDGYEVLKGAFMFEWLCVVQERIWQIILVSLLWIITIHIER